MSENAGLGQKMLFMDGHYPNEDGRDQPRKSTGILIHHLLDTQTSCQGSTNRFFVTHPSDLYKEVVKKAGAGQVPIGAKSGLYMTTGHI